MHHRNCYLCIIRCTLLILAFTVDVPTLPAVEPAATASAIREKWLTLTPPAASTGYRLVSRMYNAESGSELKLTREKEVIYSDSQDGICVDTRQFTTEGGREKREREVLLANRHYSCRLQENMASGQLLLIGLPMMNSGGEWRTWSESGQLFNRLLWLIPERTYQLPNLIDPTLSTIVKVEEPGPDLIRLTFHPKSGLSNEQKEKFGGVHGGTLLLNSKWSYRLEQAEIEYNPKDKTKVTYQLTYFDQLGSEHLLKSMQSNTNWQMNGANGPKSMTGRQTWEFEQRPGSNDPSFYYMSHFGLPEPEGLKPPSKPIPLYVWLLASGGVLAMFTVLIRLVIRRRRATPTSSPSAPHSAAAKPPQV